MAAERWNRRPLQSRNTAWAALVARWLIRLRVRPNQISLASVVAAAGAGFCLLSAWYSAAALLILVRLLCNLMDGMVAIEGGCGSASGEIYNDLPDRDYVYRDQPGGATLAGRLIDRIYLNSPGWRGIRERKRNVEALLRRAVNRVSAEGKAVHIFDPAAGGGRYVLETVMRLKGVPITVTLRDCSPANVEAASKLARELGIPGVTVGQGDAFDRGSVGAVAPRPAIAVVSGLYELFPDNALVRESLLGLAEALGEGGYLIYTNQPWHPQLEMIARVLDNREGKPWVMRCRPQAEMDTLVRSAGFQKLETLIDADGIFSVSLTRLTSPVIATPGAHAVPS